MRRVIVLLVAASLVVPTASATASTPSPAKTNVVVGLNAAAPADPLAYWRFDEGSGITAADSSGNGLDGSITGAIWVPRRSGSALSFASWSDRVVVPRTSVLEPATVTVDAWVKANGTPGPWAQIVGKGETVCTAASFSLYTGPGSGLAFFISDGANAVLSPTVGTSIWNNAWHHIAGSFDGTKVHLYVDGSEIGTGTPTNGMQISYALTLTNDLAIGSALTQCPGGNKPWVGEVDDVRVWGRALTLQEIRDLLPATTTSLASSPNPSDVGASVTHTASVTPSLATGSVVFRDVTGGGSAIIGIADLADGVATISTTFQDAGSHQLVAAYQGSADYDPSTSPMISHEVLPPDETVSATGVGVQYAKFYPYKDGYRDTVAIRGTPGEPVSVSIKVYNGAGKKVRSWSLAPRASAWSITWNGKKASGTRLAAGKYKVVQTLRDTLGNTRAFTSYVTISDKRLRYYTKSQTKYGASFSAYDYTYYAWVSPAYSVFYRGVDLFGNSYTEYAAVRYTFRLPAAVVYKSLKWSALGKSRSGGGPATLELWNFKHKNYDANKKTGRSYGWYSLSASAKNRVSSRKVFAWVTAYGGNFAHWDVAKVKLTYTYAVLK